MTFERTPDVPLEDIWLISEKARQRNLVLVWSNRLNRRVPRTSHTPS